LKNPLFRDTILIHYIFTGKLKTDAYFVYNYDNKFLNYRTTLYDNYSKSVGNKLRVTVEIFDENNSFETCKLKEIIFKELIDTNIIDSKSQLIDSFVHVQNKTWPAFEKGFFKNQRAQNEIILNNLSNVFLAGRTNGKLHTNALINELSSFFE